MDSNLDALSSRADGTQTPETRIRPPTDGNWVGALQEHLQRLAPTSGCRPEELWKYDEPISWTPGSRVRIVLLNTRGGQRVMEPSDPHEKRKPARQQAAQRALISLLSRDDRPHDPQRVPLALNAVDTRSGCGGANPATMPDVVLPPIAHLLAVEPVILLAKNLPLVRGADDHVSVGIGTQSEETTGMLSVTLDQPAQAVCQSIPRNLGQLGEKYAFHYLNQQAWVQPGSVDWLNRSREAGHDHDVVCVPLGEPGRSAVEVKTRWIGCRVKLTPRQLSRVLDPADDYMVLVVGDACNLFGSPPRPPQLRIVHSPPRADCTGLSSSRETRPALPGIHQSGRRLPLLANDVADRAEALVDRVLESGATGLLPPHIIEFLHHGCVEQLRRQWPANRKTSYNLMLVEAGRNWHDSHDPIGVSIRLAIETLLRLSAAVRVGTDTDNPTVDPPESAQHGRQVELCINDFACSEW